ncbi:MAG: hypothetical protein LRY56_09400 [Burkholderiaceae bacterium]|nr:hypothetical protein [Burkholderiaceae bacterium]MCD8516984.1 hypothetical protein [Burkholderiaceae bacterium]MCD8537678.1 hypothetical protein [Burkholderiaceae bacterium]
MHSNDDKRRAKLWFATSEIDEYFRLLGGSGCYTGYSDWHVPALLTLAFDYQISDQSQADQNRFEYSVRDLISHRMWEHTDGLPQRAVELVTKLKPTPEDTVWFTDRVSERYPMAYGSYEKEGWADFLEQRQYRKMEQSGTCVSDCSLRRSTLEANQREVQRYERETD